MRIQSCKMSILRLISYMRARVFAALAVFLTQPVERYSPATTTDPETLSAVLRHGDVLLTEGNTRAAALIKRITRSTWSHVSMYVGPLEEGWTRAASSKPTWRRASDRYGSPSCRARKSALFGPLAFTMQFDAA